VPLNEAALITQNTVDTRNQHWIEDVWAYQNNPDGSVTWLNQVPYPVPPKLSSFAWNNGSVDVLDGNLKYPYTDHWTLGVQRQITNQLAVNVDFVRVLGRNQWTIVDRNAPNPDSGPYYPRPDPSYFHVDTQSSIGHSWYTALEATVKYQGKKGLATLTYTRSKSIDDVRGDPNGWGATCSYAIDQDPSALRCDRGLSANDLPNRLTFDGTYYMPFGFTFTATVDYHSGYPWTVYAGQDLNGDGFSNEVAPGYSRDDQRGQRYIWTTMRLGRVFKFNDRMNWEPWIDIFNITNTPTYFGYDGNILDQPPNVPDNPVYNTFAQPLSSTGPRIFQFGCRFTF
jgi:hypothetical protein